MDGSNPQPGGTPLDAARDYAARGWHVVPMHGVRGNGVCTCSNPACDHQGKHPRGKHGFKEATADIKPELFRSALNLGIATGPQSGCWVLDVDGADGARSLATLTETHGPLPRTVEVRTGGGGLHCYFAYPADRAIRNTVRSLGPGLDVRGDGGGVVAPPSLHRSGRRYAWAPGRSPTDIALAAAPAWLLDLVAPPPRPSAPAPKRPAGPRQPDTTSSAYAETALEQEILRVFRSTEGTRNDTLHRAAVSLGSLVGANILERSFTEGELIKAAIAAGLPQHEAAATTRSGLDFGIANPRDMAAVAASQEDRKRAANVEAQASRRRRLADNAAAQAWLDEQGLTRATIDHFGFGLDKPYQSPASGKTYSDALTFPLRAIDGTPVAAICKANIPGITAHPKGAYWTSSSSAGTFYAKAGAAPAVLICDMLDLWRCWQEVGGAEATHQVIASTAAGGTPEEWAKATFWEAWDRIYVATPADPPGDNIAAIIHRAAGKPVQRVRPPQGTWREAIAAGADIAAAIARAPEIENRVSAADDKNLGRKAYQPLDIGRAFHNGHLYYPVDTLVRGIEVDKDGVVRTVEHVETIVIRSDGKQLHAVEMEAPKGTPADKRVMRLSDTTLIDSAPKASAHPSWSWAGIQGWLDGKAKGAAVPQRSFEAIIEDVRQALKAAIWLPYEEDYTVLALATAASYCQAVFQAVPLLLLSGEPGSGKSTAGIMMAALAANGTIVGQVNAAAAARLIHETKGLIVLDDLESINARPGKDGPGGFSELVQWLKVSYNRDTATKVWVDASRNFKVERLNGFGIKVINNTTGVDSILGTRMIRVQTRKMPAAQAEARRGITPLPPEKLQALRDEMHAWTFEHVELIAKTYTEICPNASERSEEIAAPLRVLARISGAEQHSAALEAALSRGGSAAFTADDPAEVLKEAATILARAGYVEVSPTHIILEVKRLVDAFFGKASTTDIPEYEQPEWVGRTLRSRDILASGGDGKGYRKRLWGKNLRVYPFTRTFLEEALADQAASPPPLRTPTDFCCGCASCPYRSHGCPFMEERLEAERTQGPKAGHA